MKAGISFQRRLNTILFVVALVFFLGVGGTSTVVLYNKKMAAYAELLQARARLTRNLIQTHFQLTGQRTATLVRQVQTDPQQEVNSLEQKLYPTIASDTAYVLDNNGRVLLINPALRQFVGFDLSHMPYRRESQAVTSSFQSVFSNRSVVAQLYHLSDGKLLVIEHDAQSILAGLDFFVKDFQGNDFSFFIMDQQGVATYHPDPDVVRSRHNLAFDLKKQGRNDHGLDHIIYHNQPYYAWQQTLEQPAGWRLILVVSAADIKATLLWSMAQQLVAIFLFLGLISLTLSFFLNRYFRRPVEQIVKFIGEYQSDRPWEAIPVFVPGAIAEFQKISCAIKKMAQNINASRRQLAVILNSLDALVYVADMATYELLFVNAYGRKIWGDDITGKICWQTLQQNQDGPCSFCSNDRLLDREGRATGVYAWELQNTVTKAWYDCRDQAIPWNDGRMVRLEIATEISERKRTEEALRQERFFLQAAFDTMEEGIVACDADGLLSRFNEAARRFYGIPDASIPPEEWPAHFDIYLPDGKTMMRKEDVPLYRALQGEKVQDSEMMIIPKKGPARILLAGGRAWRDPEGNIIGAVVSMHDITRRKAAEEELQKHRDRLDLLVRERTSELDKKNKELEALNRYFVDREFRIKELKMMVEMLQKTGKDEGEQ